jgi:hypothetical protein
VAVKPAVGVLDTMTKTAQGVRNQADSSHAHSRERVRLPRYIGQDKVIFVRLSSCFFNTFIAFVE